ncbi:hypothetical protein JQ633_16070 [Bradyrhizobium tropiciagri]|uniref:hypothetical protein n=1 Tax=Bradyrhizobium tropiciagri TaxID=312253 RepID=UPI001BA6891A|nr:hypothetical protein [Bradyrhizobium tropiciagri]MBR0871883.1 hypothetical protein [Bradyrhizobium tropiciagri]
MSMRISDATLRQSLIWSVPALLYGNVTFADDAKKIAEAQAACVKLATTYLDTVSQRDRYAFVETANVSSDPTDNIFQFRWENANCQGNADQRKITHLSIGSKDLACSTPDDDLRLTAACALSY